MAFKIVLAPEAITALKNLPVPIRSGVEDAIERHLTHDPAKISKSRIKRLRGLSQPQFRLRIGGIRVFYDVTETEVQILDIVTKAQAEAWLKEQGTQAPDGTEGRGSG
jgi:mRNA interferase RelE/StbE